MENGDKMSILFSRSCSIKMLEPRVYTSVGIMYMTVYLLHEAFLQLMSSMIGSGHVIHLTEKLPRFITCIQESLGLGCTQTK